MNEAPGVDACYWWVGQVTEKESWQKEQTGIKHLPEQTKGETFSYKVRIIGRHTAETPAIDLPTASLALPVTAGGGLGGSAQTPNIREYSYVAGFYKDGKDGNDPLIAFILPVNPKTNLLPGQPKEGENNGFAARSAFQGRNIPVPTDQIVQNQNPKKESPTESIDPNLCTIADKARYVDGKRFFYIPKTKACEGPSGPLKGIQKTIGEAIAITNLVKSGILGSSSDLPAILQNQLNSTQTQLTALTKGLIDSMRAYIINKINKELTERLDKFNPQDRIKFSKNFESVSDIVLCIFQKILKNLKKLVKDTWDKLIDKYINAPLCAAENFVAGIISNIFSELSNGLSAALGALNIGGITDQIFTGLSVFVGILEFLTCEEELNCEMPEQWSIFSGPKKFLENVNEKIDQRIAGITSSLQAGGEVPICNTAQIPCGPPTVSFVSSSGSGAFANPIVSFTGSIIGLDIISGGGGYSSPPSIEFVDNCGNGSGAAAVAVMKKDENGNDTDVVDKVVMVDSGTGYLQYPDGSTGGNGFTFSNPNDTIVFNQNTGYSVYECGTTVNVLKGDLIYLKSFANATVYDNEGNILQEIIGKGPTVPVTIDFNGTLTTPPCEDPLDTNKGEFPSSDNSYPVVLTIDDIAVTNSGANYSEGDTVSINPSNGAEILISFDQNGSIKDVIVVNGGIGFTEIPEITIQSQTGFNGNLIPVFRVLRIGDLKEGADIIPPNTPIMNVVDCVGVVEK